MTTSVAIRDLRLIRTNSEITESSPWKCRRSEPRDVKGNRHLEYQAHRDVDAGAVHRAVRQTRPRRFTASPVLTMVLLLSLGGTGQAQVMGEEAELDRLRVKAEDAMGNDDAESAAMSMGRAALMAAQLAKRHTDAGLQHTFKTAEHLYRSQEHGYRAIALFRRAGGELPASAGVCGSLQLARLELQHAQEGLNQPGQAPATKSDAARLGTVRQTTDDWATLLESMQGDFRCPS